MAYQSLYRRYRPRTFAEIKGQDHVTAALRSAVRENRVGHAYLFHGPRGTGKTTTARVLAKALNCTNLGADGEPCAACESCLSIEQNRSFDLHELDAASNNKVDDMRALLERVKLGTPGRAKVYLLDEAHMLTPGAENALLKTLEEPPEHVTWVLATTEPHKVVETIRSRCQVFELGLLGADALADHVRFVSADAGLDAADEVIDHVVAAGAGSVRDTLSALDRVAAAGGVVELDDSTGAILDALADHDPAAALAAVDDALGRGRDPRRIGEGVLSGLRNAFLTAMGSPPDRLAEPERAQAEALVSRLAPASMTRALETLGAALVDMRQSPDPRVDLEVAMVRLTRPDADRSLDALAERVARLEAQLGLGSGNLPTGSELSSDPGSPGPAEAGSSGSPAQPVPPAESSPPPSASSAPPARPAWQTNAGEQEPKPPSASLAPSAGSPPPPEVAEFSASGGDGGQPVAQLRRTLAQSRGPATSPNPPTAESPPPPPVPTVDLRDLRPQTSREVLDLAVGRLGLSRDEVVAKAKAMLPEGSPRNAETLAPVWRALVDSAATSSDQAGDPGSSAPVPLESDMVPLEPGPPAPVPPEPGPPEPESPAPEPDVMPSEPGPPALVSPEPGPPMPDPDAPPPSEPPPLELQEPPSPESESSESLGSLALKAFPGSELVTVDEDDTR